MLYTDKIYLIGHIDDPKIRRYTNKHHQNKIPHFDNVHLFGILYVDNLIRHEYIIYL